jgi:hypothetical protein
LPRATWIMTKVNSGRSASQVKQISRPCLRNSESVNSAPLPSRLSCTGVTKRIACLRELPLASRLLGSNWCRQPRRYGPEGVIRLLKNNSNPASSLDPPSYIESQKGKKILGKRCPQMWSEYDQVCCTGGTPLKSGVHKLTQRRENNRSSRIAHRIFAYQSVWRRVCRTAWPAGKFFAPFDPNQVIPRGYYAESNLWISEVCASKMGTRIPHPNREIEHVQSWRNCWTSSSGVACIADSNEEMGFYNRRYQLRCVACIMRAQDMKSSKQAYIIFFFGKVSVGQNQEYMLGSNGRKL